MYLVVYLDGTISQFADNLTVDDVLLVASRSIKVLRFNIDRSSFEYLLKDEKTLHWIPVKDAEILLINNFRIHH